MSNYKLRIEKDIAATIVKLSVIFYTDSQDTIPFKFGNASKSFQRDRVFIEAEGGRIVEAIQEMYLNPIKSSVTETNITKENPFTYEVVGKIKDLGNKIELDLSTASYHLTKGKVYRIYVKIGDTVSNKLEISF
jgi:hypothetical protein